MTKRRLILAAVLIFGLSCLVYLFLHRGMSPAVRLPANSQALSKLINQGLRLSELLVPYVEISLKLPDSLYVDPILDRTIGYVDSTLVIVNSSERRIWLVNLEGRITKMLGGKGSGPGEFMNITCFAISPLRLLYFYDHLAERITVFTLQGKMVKTIALKAPGLRPRHMAVDSTGRIFIHHPPSAEYPGFIAILDSTGKVIENLRTDVDWKYGGYYFRGFLDGDVLVLDSGKIIEANLFSYRVYFGGVENRFIASGTRPRGYTEIPRLSNVGKENFESVFFELPLYRNFSIYDNRFVLQSYASPDDKKYGKPGVLRAFDLHGNYIGNVEIDVNVIPNMGDQRFAITIKPRVGKKAVDEKNPFSFIIHKWRPLSELMNGTALGNNVLAFTVTDVNSLRKIELGKLPGLRLVGIVSENDCGTCVDILLSELQRVRAEWRSKGSPAVVVVIHSSPEFVNKIKWRYNMDDNLFEIARGGSLPSPALFALTRRGIREFTVTPDTLGFLHLRTFVDSVLSEFNGGR